MPRAADYRQAAQVLRGRSAALAEAASAHRRHRIGEFGDGPIGAAHDDAMSSIASRYNRAGDELAELARVCDHRAVVCDEYAAEIARWHALAPWVRSSTPFPPRPADWAQP